MNEANRPNERQKNDVEREWHSKQKTFPATERKKASFMLESPFHVLKDSIHDQRNIMDLHLWIKLKMRTDILFLSFSSFPAVHHENPDRDKKKCRRNVPEMVEFVKRQININGSSFSN